MEGDTGQWLYKILSCKWSEPKTPILFLLYLCVCILLTWIGMNHLQFQHFGSRQAFSFHLVQQTCKRNKVSSSIVVLRPQGTFCYLKCLLRAPIRIRSIVKRARHVSVRGPPQAVNREPCAAPWAPNTRVSPAWRTCSSTTSGWPVGTKPACCPWRRTSPCGSPTFWVSRVSCWHRWRWFCPVNCEGW